MTTQMDDAEVSGNAPGSAPAGRRPQKRGTSWYVSWLVVVLVAALASVLLRTFVVQTFFVPSASMEPTLQVGDRILVQKIGFSLERGDIVVFHHPARDAEAPLNEDLVKRIIG